MSFTHPVLLILGSSSSFPVSQTSTQAVRDMTKVGIMRLSVPVLRQIDLDERSRHDLRGHRNDRQRPVWVIFLRSFDKPGTGR